MRQGVPSKVIAASMGLSAFTVAVCAGLAAENEVGRILTRAILSMVICHAVGWAVGFAGEWAVLERVEAYGRANPLAQDVTVKELAHEIGKVV